MIPISLVVSLELVKFFQTKGIEFDALMWANGVKSKVLNMLIHEDLAKIEYIFADKTGTLTSNEMRFTYCSINGAVYSKDELIEMANMDLELKVKTQGTNNDPDTFTLFWLAITLCHDVIIDQRQLESNNPREKYQVRLVFPLYY